MRWAVIAAVAVHAMILLVPVACPNAGSGFVPFTPQPEPLIVSLREPDAPKSLIEPGAPAQGPVDPTTNLIAERASKAQDMTNGDSGGITPDAGRVGESNELAPAQPPTPQPTAAPAPVAAAPPTPDVPERKPEPKELPAPKPKAEPESVPPAEVKKPVMEQPEHEDSEEPQDAAIIVAKADTPRMPEREAGPTRSTVEGGVKSKGFLSYEAMESDFAPYLRSVRDRVEKRWKALIHMRYSGASATRAVIDCAISPDGKLNAVTIIEYGDSATYAGLCKLAIEQAGPFGPFPFSVPEMYRNQNIEIRWTFTFL